MIILKMNLINANLIWQLFILISYSNAADDDYNIVQKDGSFQFGYTNPDSYHFADGNRNNVVRGEFGERNPKSGAIDATVYTAGPRGYRPRGKNVYRKYDLNQNGPRPVGSRDDPFYDPYEDPSYNFAFRTRTYSKQEAANRVGDVSGRYTYLDDVGERHNVEYIAGKNTGFHVKTPFPDSDIRPYGSLYFRGRGRPIPRGRTSIQRGLDGSYKFVSAGPDQRRTEVSDSTGHVRGSYTYLDDKGVQHSVHYIAGPETGYRVLKSVKGPHLPTVYPFDTPEILPPDFYSSREGDLFDTAASGRPLKPGKPSRPTSNFGNSLDIGKEDYDRFGGEKQDNTDLDNDGGLSSSSSSDRPRPTRPSRPSGGDNFGDTSSAYKPSANRPVGAGSNSDGFDDDDFGDLFGGSTTSRPGSASSSRGPTGRPTITTFRPTPKPGLPLDEEDDGSYKPERDGISFTRKPAIGSTTTYSPGPSHSGGTTTGATNRDYNDSDGFNQDSNSQNGNGAQLNFGSKGSTPCSKCSPTIVRNTGSKPFKVPPGGFARAHVQSIDLYPYYDWSESSQADKGLKREQLNEASSGPPLNKIEEAESKISSDNSTEDATSSPVEIGETTSSD